MINDKLGEFIGEAEKAMAGMEDQWSPVKVSQEDMEWVEKLWAKIGIEADRQLDVIGYQSQCWSVQGHGDCMGHIGAAFDNVTEF